MFRTSIFCLFLDLSICDADVEKFKHPLYDRHPLLRFSWTSADNDHTVRKPLASKVSEVAPVIYYRSQCYSRNQSAFRGIVEIPTKMSNWPRLAHFCWRSRRTRWPYVVNISHVRHTDWISWYHVSDLGFWSEAIVREKRFSDLSRRTTYCMIVGNFFCCLVNAGM